MPVRGKWWLNQTRSHSDGIGAKRSDEVRIGHQSISNEARVRLQLQLRLGCTAQRGRLRRARLHLLKASLMFPGPSNIKIIISVKYPDFFEISFLLFMLTALKIRAKIAIQL